MNKLYYVDPNGVLTTVTNAEIEVPLKSRQHFIHVVDENSDSQVLVRESVHETKQSALEAQRAIFEKEAKTELQNIFLANQRHGKLMQRLVDIDIELYDLRKGESLPPITDTQVKL
jgi:hypothetical protein